MNTKSCWPKSSTSAAGCECWSTSCCFWPKAMPGRLQVASEQVELDSVVRKAYDMFLGVAEAADVDLRIAILEPGARRRRRRPAAAGRQ